MARFIGSHTPPTTASPYDSGWRVTEYTDRLTGTVFCDKAGTLYVDHSPDQTNADWADTVAVLANTGAKYSIELVASYYRIRFVPATDATVFRIFARPSSAGGR